MAWRLSWGLSSPPARFPARGAFRTFARGRCGKVRREPPKSFEILRAGGLESLRAFTWGRCGKVPREPPESFELEGPGGLESLRPSGSPSAGSLRLRESEMAGSAWLDQAKTGMVSAIFKYSAGSVSVSTESLCESESLHSDPVVSATGTFASAAAGSAAVGLHFEFEPLVYGASIYLHIPEFAAANPSRRHRSLA